MSDPVSLNATIHRALAARHPQPARAARPVSVAKMKHNMEAEKVVRDTLEGWGTPDLVANGLLKQKTLCGGKLANNFTGKLSAEGRELTRMMVSLKRNPHATDKQKIGFVAHYTAMKAGRGGRKALEGLASKPQFWKWLTDDQRAIVYRRLAGASSPASARKLGQAYAKLIQDRTFGATGTKSRESALRHPERAVRLLSRYDRNKRLHIPHDETTRKNQAWNYVKKYSGWKTAEGHKRLYNILLETSDDVLTNFFRNRPTRKANGRGSVWYGESFTKHAAFSWEQTTQQYAKSRRAEEHCGNFNGRGAQCLH